MEMTIEEAIRRVDNHNYIHQGKEPRAVYITEAFDTLKEVAKKYQKIEQIVANNNNDGMIGRLVREVVQDGSN